MMNDLQLVDALDSVQPVYEIPDDDLKVDTHGAPVIDPVWQLLDTSYEHCGVVPTLLERDFNIPPLPELLAEVDTIRHLQAQHQQTTTRDIAHGGQAT